MVNSLAPIHDFLSRDRIAVVGVSSNTHEFSRSLFRALARQGYDVIPVHPGIEELDGRPCFARMEDIQPPAEAALLLTAPPVTDQVVEECAAAGITRIWIFRVSARAIDYCRSRGIEVIAGECPYMFFEHAGLVHRCHGWIRKIAGSYPR